MTEPVPKPESEVRGAPWFRGTGVSMIPFIRDASLLTVDECAPSGVLPGDIVVYRGGDVFICHRVVLRRWQEGDPWVYILGNDPTRPDGWVRAERILGKVSEINGRRIPHWKKRLFYWHGWFEVVAVHKLFQNRLAKFISGKMKRYFRYRVKSLTYLFLLASAAPWRGLFELRRRRYFRGTIFG